MITFLSEVKYIISNAIVIVSYERSYNIKISTLIPLYSRIKTKLVEVNYTGRFLMFSVTTNIYNKKTKGPTLMELFTATGKLIFILTTRDVRCVHHG